MSVTHWAISAANGDDANDGSWDGTFDNAKATWGDLFVDINATTPFTGPQVVHIGNESAFTSQTTIGNVPYNLFHGEDPLVLWPEEESTSGLYFTFPDGSTHPSWKIEMANNTHLWDGVSNRPQQTRYCFGEIAHSGTGLLTPGGYSTFHFCKIDGSAISNQSYVINGGTNLMENCHIIGGDGVSTGAQYGVAGGDCHYINCLFEGSRGAAIWANGNGTIDNCVFYNNSTGIKSVGHIYNSGTGIFRIKNSVIIGQGPTSTDRGIYSNPWINTRLENCLFVDVDEPVRVTDEYILAVGQCAFYNCGETELVAKSGTIGWEKGLLFPPLSSLITLDDVLNASPIIDAAGGNFGLTDAASQVLAGRGQILPGGWPGSNTTHPPMRTDVGLQLSRNAGLPFRGNV